MDVEGAREECDQGGGAINNENRCKNVWLAPL